MTAEEVLTEAKNLSRECKNVIFTGGEPLLQLLKTPVELLAAFKNAGYFVAIETNGSINPEYGCIDWITCSPKVAEHCIKCLRANEVKYVRGYGQAIPVPTCKADYYLISPAFDGNAVFKRTMDWCVNLVKENPTWRLSCQQHKFWSVR